MRIPLLTPNQTQTPFLKTVVLNSFKYQLQNKPAGYRKR